MKVGVLHYDTTLTFKKSVNRFVRITLPQGTPFLLTNNNIIFKPQTVELTELVFNGSKFLITGVSVNFVNSIHIYKSANGFYISVNGQSFQLYFRNPEKASKMFPLSLLLKS